MPGRLPDARSNSLARQIDLICAPQLMSVEAALAAHIGGSARVIPDHRGHLQ
jgi:hypothetical protein